MAVSEATLAVAGMDTYLALSPAEMQRLAAVIASHASSHFQIATDERGIIALHRGLGTRFRYLPPGRYNIGLSLDEEAAARKLKNPFPATIEEMRPVVSVQTGAMLVSEGPITNDLAQGLVPCEGDRPWLFPAMLEKHQADKAARIMNCRLPTEAEWEVACRAGSKTLFVFGNGLPVQSELARWMEWDLSQPMRLPSNRLGLVGLFFGEWCSDEFRENYTPGAPAQTGTYVVRGGGAFFWPWQDDEWVWCMSAMRMPSSALPPDGRCAARLVFDLAIS